MGFRFKAADVDVGVVLEDLCGGPTCGVPLYGIDLIPVALKGFQRLVLPKLAHIDDLIRAARGKGRVVAPVHIQSRRCT